MAPVKDGKPGGDAGPASTQYGAAVPVGHRATMPPAPLGDAAADPQPALADAVMSWPAVDEKGLPMLPEVIDKMGFGMAQVRAGLVGGGCYFADGAELLLISAVTDAVATQWSMGPMQKGLVVTIVFIGILVGNFASGPIGDAHGRRQLILSSFIGIFAFSVASSFTVGFWSLSVARFCVGVSFGIGQPAWNTLGAEVTPADYRIMMSAMSQGFFILGELYSATLLMVDDPQMKDLHWRWLLRMGAIPSGIFGIACLLFMHQSPSYLAVSGQYEKAKEVLQSMRHDNGHPDDMSVDFALVTRKSQLKRMAKRLRAARRLTVLSKDDLLKQVRVVFGPNLWLSTLIVMYSCFVLNFLYYGCLYALPQVLASSAEPGSNAALELLTGALAEIPGQVLGILCGTYLTRKFNIKVYLGLSSLSLMSFVFSLIHPGGAAKIFQLAGIYGIKCFVAIGFVVVYQYSIEIYPTEARTTGTAINMGSGRVAGIISPLIFEGVVHMTGGYSMFFYLMIGCAVLNFLLIPLLKYETFGMALMDDIDDEDEAEAGKSEQANEEQDEVAPLLESKTIRHRARTVFFAEPLMPRF